MTQKLFFPPIDFPELQKKNKSERDACPRFYFDSILLLLYLELCFISIATVDTFEKRKTTKTRKSGHVGVYAVVNPYDTRELRFCSVFPSFLALWSSTDNDDDHQLKRERP
jgi:hypothetical protein